MQRIFFYGLFMDADLLRGMGLHPTVTGPASLPGYQIRIGNRATLIPGSGSTAYGMLIELPDDEANALYSAPDVSDYLPEEVDAVLLSDHTSVSCLCYNLSLDNLGTTVNTQYAEQLSALALRLGFPPDYATDIGRQRDA